MDSNFPLLFLTFLFTIIATNSFHSHSQSTTTQCPETERRALVNVKKNVPPYFLSSWEGDDCCTWMNVECNDTTGNVISLYLYAELSHDSSLDGNVLLPLLSLHHLAHLDISGDNFTGSRIPKFIGSFQGLQYLDLSHSGFVGRVPDELGNLSTLYELRISDGLFIENTRWISQLRSIRYLSMEGMNLTKAPSLFQALNTLPFISELHISSCLLNPLPPLLHVNFTSLTKLDLGGNNLYQSLPDWLWHLQNLTFLDVSCNSFYGSLPAAIGNLSLLEELDLSVNKLSGPIPNTITQLRSQDYLYLISNSFNGSLQEIQFPDKIKNIYLNDNLFSGALPATIGNLSSLSILSLPRNKLNNLENIAQLRSLQELDMSYNSLIGTLSEAHFMNMSMLASSLDFSYNPLLSFNISDNWVPTFQLEYLYLDSCQVGPRFPGWLKTQYSLQILSLSNTGIKGLIPNWFVNFSFALHQVDLSDNDISGQLSQFCNSNFTDLNLSNNSLSGSIPKKLGEQMIYLLSLDLSTNSFHGKIPLTLCNLSNLIELHLSDNILTGEIPPCLTNFTDLASLDLGYNKLTGNIPPWIRTEQPKLNIMSLASNALTGRIPNLSYLKDLRILDLSNNNLSGHIPPSLGNLTAMSILHNMRAPYGYTRVFHVYLYFRDRLSLNIGMWLRTKGKEFEFSSTMLPMVTFLDLSSNALSGHIPDELAQLHGLQTLNLSGNNLTGRIPTNIDGLQHLETLDLSRNNLLGTIPGSLQNLYSLEDLDLSYNNLSGKIPTGGQLQSFDNESIYEGNPNLCGFPLIKSCSDETDQHGFNNNKDEGFFWLYIAVAPGFVVGFWAVWRTLILATKLRFAYFQAIDKFFYRLGWLR